MSWSEKIYKAVIQAYPQDYLDKYQDQMLLNFRDLEREHKSFGKLWLLIIHDFIKSLITQYMQISFTLTKSKNILALLTLLFVLPFFVFLGFAMVFQLFHMTNAALGLNHLVDHNLGWFGVFIGVLPFVALLLNLFALVYYAWHDNAYRGATFTFLKSNFFNVAVLCLAALIILFIAGHDTIPCTAHHFFSGGWRSPFKTFSWCVANS
jgi:hypothetical protein